MNLSANDDFISVRIENGAPRTDGVARAVFGHQVARGLDRPDGIYAWWLWDGTTLSVANDPLGFYPIFYAAAGEQVSVSPSITQLLATGADPALDDEGIAVFLRLGFFIGDRTPFRAIRALPPGATLTWRDGIVSVAGGLPLISEERTSRNAAIERYAELMAQSIARRPSGARPVVPLSGGVDSRHILLELHRQGGRPECVTAGPLVPFCVDERGLAAKLAARLGLPHIGLAQPESRFEREIRKNVETGFCTDEHAWFPTVAEHLAGRADTVYDGLGGDVLSAPLFLTSERHSLYQRGDLRRLAEALMPYERSLARSLTPAAYSRFGRTRAVESVESELARYRGAAIPIKAFFLFNRTRREVALAPYRMLRDCGIVYSPYLDHDVYEFLSSLPAEILSDSSFHVATVHASFPQHADIGFSPKQHAGPASRRVAVQYTAALMRYVVGGGGSNLLRLTHLLPRLLRAAVDRRYAAAFLTGLGPFAIYVLQLERYLKEASAVAQSRPSRSPLLKTSTER